ncbi:RNA polymerase sigma factor [Spirillospora sp. NPDC048911]|uniref:RNA polymerase sigma factor n=1 Tax=Spirillospora sp. NPDC048911 TaxID=3364527 RepID=UPI00371281B9
MAQPDAAGPPGGDAPASFEDFYHRHYATLIKAALALGATWDEASETVDQVMLEAWKRWDDLRQPLAWARRAAFHDLLKIKRREQRHQADPLDLCPEEQGHEASMNIWADRQWVLQLLERLPPAQREVMAHVFDGLTPAETAEYLGKTQPNVRKNLQLARERLKRELRKAGDHPACRQLWEEESGESR